MSIIQQGANEFGAFVHAILPQVEANVTHFLTANNGKVMLHRILATGEVVSQEMNLPYLRQLLQVVDTVIPQ